MEWKYQSCPFLQAILAWMQYSMVTQLSDFVPGGLLAHVPRNAICQFNHLWWHGKIHHISNQTSLRLQHTHIQTPDMPFMCHNKFWSLHSTIGHWVANYSSWSIWCIWRWDCMGMCADKCQELSLRFANGLYITCSIPWLIYEAAAIGIIFTWRLSYQGSDWRCVWKDTGIRDWILGSRKKGFGKLSIGLRQGCRFKLSGQIDIVAAFYMCKPALISLKLGC